MEGRAPQLKKPGRRLLRRLLVLSSLPLGLYALLLALLYFNQERLIFPGSQSQGKPGVRFQPPAGTDLVHLKTPRGERIVALFGPALDSRVQVAADASRRPTILLFYGNGTWLEDAVGTVQHFRKLGCNVLAPEYVGYGLSSGRPGEAACRDTAEAAFRYAAGRKDLDPRRLVAVGYSLGGAVAVDLASRRPVAGLVTLNTFTSMTEMVARLYPLAPTFLLRHPFPSLERMARVRCPAFIAHGDADALIPPEMSARLAAAAPGPVTREIVPGAEHNNLFSTADETFFRKLRHFLASAGVHTQLQPPR